MTPIRRCVKCGGIPPGPTRRGMCHNCYETHRRRQKGYGRWESSYVPAGPARRHIQQLQESGLGLRRISELSGVNRSALQTIMIGKRRGGGRRPEDPAEKIFARNAARILAVPLPDTVHRVAADGTRVDAIGTIRRLQSLVRFGYTRTYLAERAGWTVQNFCRLLDPRRTIRVNADTARKVDELFRELQNTPGPSQRARNDGIHKGWLLPFEWDEDELDRFVVTDQGEDKSDDAGSADIGFAERYVELRDDLGYSDSDIARRLGIKPESLEQNKLRHAAQIADERSSTTAEAV